MGCAQAKAMSQAEGQAKPTSDSGTGAPPQGASGALGLSQANFGPKYEQHVAQLQKQMDEAQAKAATLQQQLKDLT